jgi:PAS domain S-box-containing protein
MYLHDVKGTFVDGNTAAEDLTGYKRNELIGKSFLKLKLLPLTQIPKAVKLLAENVLGRPTGPNELILNRKDGSQIPVEIRTFPVTIDDQPLVLGIARDITERVRAEEELQEREEMLRNIIENSDDMVSAKDLNGRFIYWHSAPRYGFKTEEVIGKTYYDFENPATAARKIEENRQIASTGKSLIIENQVTLNGKNYWFSSLKYPIRSTSGKIVAIGTIERNITKLKHIEEKLRVVGGFSRHDGRNKLAIINANTYLANQALPQDHEALQYLREVESAVGQMVRIFDFAKIYEQIGLQKLEYIDVGACVKDAVHMFSSLDVEVVNDCSGLKVLVDSVLRQLFYNLIDNSLKHDETVSQIRLYYEETKDELRLIYEDNGVGIPQTEKEKIFEEGYGKGTGYGLFLIERMCEVYGWTIKENGKPSQGVRFIMTLPKAQTTENNTSYPLSK